MKSMLVIEEKVVVGNMRTYEEKQEEMVN